MEDRCRKEIENYLRTPKLDFEEDPLLWWKTASLKLSILSHKAHKYLCVCYKLTFRKSLQLFRKHCYSFTSSPSERVFSCSGNIVTPLRAHLQKESSVVQETLLLLYELTFRKSLQLFRKHCYSFMSSLSERLFSCSGNIVTPLRASMNPLKVDMLTFLSKNLK